MTIFQPSNNHLILFPFTPKPHCKTTETLLELQSHCLASQLRSRRTTSSHRLIASVVNGSSLRGLVFGGFLGGVEKPNGGGTRGFWLIFPFTNLAMRFLLMTSGKRFVYGLAMIQWLLTMEYFEKSLQRRLLSVLGIGMIIWQISLRMVLVLCFHLLIMGYIIMCYLNNKEKVFFSLGERKKTLPCFKTSMPRDPLRLGVRERWQQPLVEDQRRRSLTGVVFLKAETPLLGGWPEIALVFFGFFRLKLSV